MLLHTLKRLKWVGGRGVSVPIIGTGRYNEHYTPINAGKETIEEVISKEALQGLVDEYVFDDYHFEFRADIYQELTKLPLRYDLHPYDKVSDAVSKSAVGYTPPLGIVDPHDTIPFHVTRLSDGTFAQHLYSQHKKDANRLHHLRIDRLEGDLFRFEEELIKIFPYHRTYVRPYCVILWNASQDAKMVLQHWYLGLGF